MNPNTQHDSSEYLSAYSEHSTILKTWLAAYGVGAPVLILSQEKLWTRLNDAGSLRLIAILFLAGVALQVLLAATNKSIMWTCYFGELKPAYKLTRRYKAADWLSERFIIDALVDIISILIFSLATYFCMMSLST
jgi:hypothetical protein